MSSKATLHGKPSLSDSDAERIAESFRDAMKGLGTDEKHIIKEITSLTNQQRQIVKEKYLAIFGHTLEEDLKSELKGEFEDVVIALLKPRFEYEAESIHKAIHRPGTEDHVVIELLCTKDASEIGKLKDEYQKLYGSDLEHDLKREDEHGALGRVYRSLATADRPQDRHVDRNLAQEEAKKLYDAGEGHFGTDEGEFVRILVSRNFAQLKATFDEYQSLAGKSIEQAIKSELTGHLEEALCAIVQAIVDKPAFFAHSLHKAMQFVGTREHDIIRILVTRCEIDMKDIKQEYHNLYNGSLHDQLKAELRGHFEEIILTLVGN